VLNFFERTLIGEIDQTSSSESLSTHQNNSWSQVINKEMQQIQNSLSSMWKQTVGKHLQELKSLMPNNQTLLKLRESYEQKMANMNELQKDLMSLWSQTKLTIISLDNKTLTPNDSELITGYDKNDEDTWKTFKDHFNRVTDKISQMWQQIDNHFDKHLLNQTDFSFQSFNSINTTKLEAAVIQMQQQFNHIWQTMANKIATSFNFQAKYSIMLHSILIKYILIFNPLVIPYIGIVLSQNSKHFCFKYKV